MLLDILDEAADLLDRYRVISVHVQDQVAARLQTATSRRGAFAEIARLPQHTQLRPAHRQVGDDMRGLVGTAVVDHDNFVIVELARQVGPDLRQRPRQAVRLVEGRDNDGQCMRIH